MMFLLCVIILVAIATMATLLIGRRTLLRLKKQIDEFSCLNVKTSSIQDGTLKQLQNSVENQAQALRAGKIFLPDFSVTSEQSRELERLEMNAMAAHRFYLYAVQDYNKAFERFPSKIAAIFFGFKRCDTQEDR